MSVTDAVEFFRQMMEMLIEVSKDMPKSSWGALIFVIVVKDILLIVKVLLDIFFPKRGNIIKFKKKGNKKEVEESIE